MAAVPKVAPPAIAMQLQPVDVSAWVQQTQAVFRALDRNSDQRIDLAEIRAGFAALDLDRDGYLTGLEALSLIEAGDRDGDGRLSPDELAALPPVQLVIDLDGNGSVSAFELTLARTDEFGRVDLDGDRRLDPTELRIAERFSYFRF